MKTETIQIVNRGRGPQLSTSRITVQDLVPYIQMQWSHEQIREIMPTLTVEEIQLIEKYVQDNYQEVMEQDRHIRERAAARRKPPEVEEVERRQTRERLEKFRQIIRQGKQEPNGDRPSC